LFNFYRILAEPQNLPHTSAITYHAILFIIVELGKKVSGKETHPALMQSSLDAKAFVDLREVCFNAFVS
jgi:hypothetical protein